MPYEVAAKNLMLARLRQAISHMSLHSGPPSAANEIRGGSYDRMRIELAEPSAGAMALTEKPMFNVPRGAIVTHAGFWTSSKGGVLLATSKASQPATFDKPGLCVVDAMLDLNLDAATVVASVN